MDIDYRTNFGITTEQFISLLRDSRLAERRPVEDETCMEGMLSNSNLIVTAWHNDKLIGIARCLTDFHYACYLSDLAVAEEYQKAGVGKGLQFALKSRLGNKCKIILIAAPDADDYYGKIGYQRSPRCWVMQPA
jgi:GNAT superfamily N-acetyltransferase